MHRRDRRMDRSIDREQWEFLAAISTDWAVELRRRQGEEAEAARQQELQEFVNVITTPDASRRELSPPSAELQEFVEAITRCSHAPIREGNWDAAKHPRRGGPPNAGWWVSTGGTTGAKDARAASVDSYSDPSGVDASMASWHPPVGHHWVPVGVTQHPDIRPLLSDEAVQYAAGAYSGPTGPHHRNTTAAGVKHPEYNVNVKKELEEFIKKNKISKTRKMTGEQMKQFADLMESGLRVNGTDHPRIGPYNRAIKGMLPKGERTAGTLDDVVAAGRKYMKHSRFRLLAAGAVVSGILGEAVAAQAKILDVAANSGYYERAVRELQSGNLANAQRLLIGDDQSLYAEIQGQVGAHAALHFKRAMEKVFADAAQRDYK